MGDLVLYYSLACVGYFITARLVKNPEKLGFTAPLQTAATGALIVAMGARMGSNDEVINNLNKIGLYAVLMTVVIMAFSVICVSILRRMMKMDRHGHFTDSSENLAEEEAIEDADSGGWKMTVFIVIAVIIGMILGYVVTHRGFMEYELFNNIAGQVIRAGLCVLLFLVGMDLGKDDTFIRDVKRIGIKVLLIPLVIAVGTLAASIVCTLFVPISVPEALAVGGGFSWYSFAPAIIMDSGFPMISAISFMHNVFRELFALLIMPIVGKKVGYLEVVAMPGSGAGDVCMPFIVKSTRSGMALYAMVTGVTLSALVPILVPIFIGAA